MSQRAQFINSGPKGMNITMDLDEAKFAPRIEAWYCCLGHPLCALMLEEFGIEPIHPMGPHQQKLFLPLKDGDQVLLLPEENIKGLSLSKTSLVTKVCFLGTSG